jgi:hypothetical protein
MSSIGSMPSYLTSLYASSTSLFPLSTSSTTVTTLPSIDSSTLVDYFSASESALQAAAEKATSAASQSSTNSSSSSSSNKSAQTPPWAAAQPSKQAEQASVLATTNFIPATTPQLVGASASDSSTQKDNQKLFTLYTAVNSLSQLAGIAGKSGVTSGELQAYDTQFQTGLSQVESYLSSTTFNNFTLQTQTPSASVTSSVSIPFAPIDYTGQTVVSDANFSSALPNVSSSQNFNIAITKGGTTTNVPIDLSQVQGPLNVTNIVDYVNQQLQADGFKTRFSTAMTSGSVSDTSTAQYGIQISQAAGETVNLSSAHATPSLYLAGNSGTSSPSVTTTPTSTGTSVSSTPADQQGRLVELDNLSSTPQTVSNTSVDPSAGNTTAQSTVVDSNGNVYVLGNATGNMGNELNQGSQGVYLSMYDSAGNLEWNQLVSGSGSASGYSMALNPKGGVVVSGSTDSNLTTGGIDNGNNDSFVAAYDSSGNQSWLTQIPTLNANQANAVTVDAQGNVYVGGQVTGSIGAGQTSSGGTNAYLAALNSNGQITSEQEYGPSGSDQVSAMATTQFGNLVVASQQNGQAVLSEYTGGSVTSTPAWQINLGNLNGGSISGVTVSGNQVYVSGTTSNAALTAGGQASVANPSSGGTNAFVFNATDDGTSATANYVTYVGNAGSSQGNGVTVGPDGTAYLAGTTTGTFAGQTRQVIGANNAFVASIGANGQVQWTQQFGGADGQSSGAAVAINPTGSSVLNALGLPSGTVDTTQSVYLSQATSLQSGDSFQIQLEGAGGSTQTVTIGQNETLSSLANQINDVLLTKGKATVTYANGGEAIKIKVNPGVTANLIAGPTGFDALSRLGIQPGTLTAPAKKGSPPAPASSSSSTAAKTVYGLDLNTTGMNLQTTASAGAAKAELANVANIIENIYQQSNTPATSTSTSSVPPSSTQNSTTVPAYLTSQISNYSLALASLESSSSSSSSSSSALLA